MNFGNFENLVNYAIGGKMRREEVSSIVSSLKSEKAHIMKSLLAMPEGTERRNAFKKLHDLMYALYKSRVRVGKVKQGSQEVDLFRTVNEIAIMVLTYDCRS